uniref:Anaphase-promoting complex subunit 5 n=1 Tax=Bionectria ochroleuca TaxID=29856 RepID=A0A8H7K242_BIOOC
MAKYLTPAKLGLLVLMELYLEGAMPSDAALPVLSFITSHLMDRTDQSSRWERAEKTVSLVVSIGDFEKLLGSHAFLMGLPGKRLWDQFLGRLWALNSLDALHIFLDTLPRLLATTKREQLQRHGGEDGWPEVDDDGGQTVKLSRHSLLGSFVRRARVEYSRLKWHDTTRLWQDFVRYRQPTAHYMRRNAPSTFGRLSFDWVLEEGENESWETGQAMTLASVAYGDMLSGDHMGSLPVSSDDVERLLEFQVQQMQKYGSRVPSEIRHQFQDLLNDSGTVPSLTHYVNFLESWRAGDYPSAFDLLHRYFDYTAQTRDRFFHQYALMNLAVLQADFGCYRDAVTAMLETVSTARENRDAACLNFALNWLFHFGRSHGDFLVRNLESRSMIGAGNLVRNLESRSMIGTGNLVRNNLESRSMIGTGKETLAFLRVRAKEAGMWSLLSSVLLSEAKLCMMRGESIATAMECLVRSSHVIVSKNMRIMWGSQLSMYGCFWDRLGLAHLATTACEVFVRAHAPYAVFEDELRLTCRLAVALASRGEYDEALRLMNSLDDGHSLRACKSMQHWRRCMGIIKGQRSLHRDDVGIAEHIVDELVQSSDEDMDPDVAWMIELMHVDLLVRRGSLQEAFARVDGIMARLHRLDDDDCSSDKALRIRLMLCKVSLLDRCGRPQRAFSMAMQASSHALKARLLPLLWQSMGAVANLLVSRGEFGPASRLLRVAIPRALEGEQFAVSGQLYSVLGDAYMGLAGRSQRGSELRKEYLARAMGAVSESCSRYSKLEDVVRQREMTAKKAVIMQLSGDMTLAAGYAAEYVSLQEKYVSLQAASLQEDAE